MKCLSRKCCQSNEPFNQFDSNTDEISMFLVQLIFQLIAGISLAQLNINKYFVDAFNGRLPSRLSSVISAKRIYSEHISREFYTSAERTENAKENLQLVLQNFIENIERNLTTSSVLKSDVLTLESDEIPDCLSKLNSLSQYFTAVSEKAMKFSAEVEHFFEVTKNETNKMLLMLRRVPSSQHFLHMDVKAHLTDYYTEMESLYVLMSEVLDDGIDYTTSSLQATSRNFQQFAGLLKFALDYFRPSVKCCKRYMDFIQQLLPEIFKCAAGQELQTAYDIYAITTWSSKYVLRQLEFRIEKLFNCFAFDSYVLRCRFLRNADADFEQLFEKIEELKIFYDIRMRKGQVSKITLLKYNYGASIREKMESLNGIDIDNQFSSLRKECIPSDFSNALRGNDLRECFRLNV